VAQKITSVKLSLLRGVAEKPNLYFIFRLLRTLKYVSAAHIVILEAFYPPVLMVTHKVGIYHHHVVIAI
jgi:hypothetical protein